MVALRRSYLSLTVIAKSENKLGKMLFSNGSLERKFKENDQKRRKVKGLYSNMTMFDIALQLM